ncbi:protein kinase domain-containing protein [Pseudoalteromonas sp. SSDWG2]|uniref:protein kinase domain-containing protein n=1 Tax=Pseudoalteromonas sp. SSDWG2 TaxID=3139391 RepID=UPI003BAC763F
MTNTPVISLPSATTRSRALDLTIKVRCGAYSISGAKPDNQDACAARIPVGDTLRSKGIVLAVADGISSSEFSALASEATVQHFISDYYRTSEIWGVLQSGQRVLQAINSWLITQTEATPYRGTPDKGYVTTLTALVLKHHSGYVFHVGDSRLYRIRRCFGTPTLECITKDHQVIGEAGQSYLSRAMGFNPDLALDTHSFSVHENDIFLLTTDGVHGHLSEAHMLQIIEQHSSDMDSAAKALVEGALAANSTDNLTAQLVCIDKLPDDPSAELKAFDDLPVPPVLEVNQEIDDLRVLRVIYQSARSHLYLVKDKKTDDIFVLKAPSIELSEQTAHLNKLMMEEWAARRVNNPHVLRVPMEHRARSAMYTLAHYIEGKSLAQWVTDNPKPSLERVRNIVMHIGKGLQALHRAGIVHCDLREQNILIDEHDHATIIDLGSASIDGVSEYLAQEHTVRGNLLITAPEYFLGYAASRQGDIFSLSLLTYFLLSGSYPYGTKLARCTSLNAQRKLSISPIAPKRGDIPSWLDDTLKRGLQVEPSKRYQELSEFLHDLHTPNRKYLTKHKPPLMERDPLRFWKAMSLVWFCIALYLWAQVNT